jgi:trans-aconitate methyltransferase
VNVEDDARAEWNRRTRHLDARKVGRVSFQDIFDRHLPKSPDLTCLEIGAIPGAFLVYLHRHHGYRITGLDFADNERAFHDTMRMNGVTTYEFVRADLLEYRPENKFDVVASFGFVEHFDDFEEILERHCDLVNAGGYLVVTMPNFRRLQFLYHVMFDRKNLEFHNLKAMDVQSVDAVLSRQGFAKLVAGYDGGLELWREERPRNPIVWALEVGVRRVANTIGSRLPNSKFYSPQLVFIYRRARA